MIPETTAKKIIEEHVNHLPPLQVILQDATGMVLASDVYAQYDIPAYNQSSMDGYAFLFYSWQRENPLQITGEIAAGSDRKILLLPGQAARIFTGAAVPEGADTVVMQEKVSASDGQIRIMDENLFTGTNVRPKGAEIKAGAIALQKDNILSPAAIGFLAGIGITTVNVYPKPAIGIIVTGRELQEPGTLLEYGQVYESNSAMLKAALQQINLTDIRVYRADDDLHILKNILTEALEQNNIVLLTGGISVGDYDFVLEATNQCEVTKLFHRVKQRPGKPLFFGKKNDRLIFGLPGNPSSVLTCFYEYVLPALQKMSNQKTGLKTLKAPLEKSFEKPAGLTHFLKGFYNGEKVAILDAQESYRLSSYARANCLVKIDEDIIHCSEGENVEIHLLPDNY